MPNKTIYVSDDDLPLFQRAQELVGGNLSGAIVTALNRFIEIEEGRQAGYEDVVVRVGLDGARKQRFSGRLLADWNRSNNSGEVMERYKIYQGRTGKFVVHLQRSDWNEWQKWRKDESGNWLKDLTGFTSLRSMLGVSNPDWGDYTVQVVETLDELRDLLPGKLYRVVVDAVENPHVEELDV
ncbi:EXLDI protein [Antrihabitans cavernicola]|uniref:EXLDI protein n=1 Tax=Antrihabitans cavernicola TaxID=2495913 RepID=A0A5A7S8Y7_9NOCA|nr:EXLDI protein [Spelaeibacter cavernicola]KAA0021612.1 EXLDI protein [Spelaeibacter cavernicola]